MHGDRIVVPLGVTNTGHRAWSPERVHVSYHWLWLVPRELVHRSRRLPYQEGIRSELTAPIAPGARTTVDVRLLAPSMPGVYWLQWDMVEEGVTWFAQVAPPQPRRLVGGAAETHRPRHTPAAAGRAGVSVHVSGIWRGGPGLVRHIHAGQAVHAVRPGPARADGGGVLARRHRRADASVVLVAAPRRFRALALFGVAAFASVLLLSDIVYYRFFGDVLSAPAVLAIGQTGQVSGSIRSLLTLESRLAADRPAGGAVVGGWAGSDAVPVRPVRTPGLWRSARWPRSRLLARCSPHPPCSDRRRSIKCFANRAVMEQLGPLPFHVYDAGIRGTRRAFAADHRSRDRRHRGVVRGPHALCALARARGGSGRRAAAT